MSAAPVATATAPVHRLEAQGLRKSYGSRTVVDGVRLAVLDSRGVAANFPSDVDAWTQAQSQRLIALSQIESQLAGDLDHQASVLGTTTRNRTALTGALTAAAAVFNTVRFQQVPANAGVGLEMKVIAAAVVGGAAITGGRGRISGTLLGTPHG